MKTLNFEALEKKITDGDKLTDLDKAYAMGVISTLIDAVCIFTPEDTDIKNKLCKLLNLISMGSSNNSYKVGDRIEINLDGFGVFTATAQKVTEDSVIFMFDDCVAAMPMNSTRTNEGGYERSGLFYWMNAVLKKAFPDEIKHHLIDISIPTYGQMFGHDEFYKEYSEPDNDEQFELMKKRKNRIADYKNNPEMFWLRNAAKKETSETDFALVRCTGTGSYYYASSSIGIRPIFTLAI